MLLTRGRVGPLVRVCQVGPVGLRWRLGVVCQTIINILNGTTWGGVPTIYRLEKCLGERLWDRGHLPTRPPPRRGRPDE